LIRDRILARTVDMLEHLRIQVSCLPETEIDVLRVIERPQQFDLAVEVTNFVMERLGHSTAPKEPRFDKTRRALAKKSPRRGRGVLKPEDEALLSGASVEE
jgi:hypothetical protein